MNKNVKKSSIKTIIIFFAVLAACILGGFIAGYIMSTEESNGVDFPSLLSGFGNTAGKFLPFVYLIASVVCFASSLAMYIMYKKKAAKWDGEDEEEINLIEAGLDIVMFISNLMTVFNMFCFSFLVWYTVTGAGKNNITGIQILNIVVFIVTYIWIFVIDKLTIDLEKSLNPEMRGDIFEFDFIKQWEASCDEAQKSMIYKAGYKAYKAGNATCMLMWLFTFIFMLAFKTGFTPVFAVCFIWVVISVTYMFNAVLLERG